MQAEVLSLAENSVKLRLAGSVFANEENRRMLEEKISSYLGFPFRVEWEFGDVAVGATLSDYEKKKEEDARARNLDVFSKDPFVAEILKQFGGQVDELSLVGMK